MQKGEAMSIVAQYYTNRVSSKSLKLSSNNLFASDCHTLDSNVLINQECCDNLLSGSSTEELPATLNSAETNFSDRVIEEKTGAITIHQYTDNSTNTHKNSSLKERIAC